MLRPELTYCCLCEGVILPVDAAEETGRERLCAICMDARDANEAAPRENKGVDRE